MNLPVRHTARTVAFLLTLGAAMTSGIPGALAQSSAPPYGPDVTLAVAEKAVAAALAEAKAKGWRLAVAVVDTHGALVHYSRMEDTQTSGPVIAVEKAKTAAMFRRSTRVFEEGLAKRPAYLGLPGVTPVIGGVPIVIDGKIAGGIGASGAASDEDEAAILVGLKAIAK